MGRYALVVLLMLEAELWWIIIVWEIIWDGICNIFWRCTVRHLTHIHKIFLQEINITRINRFHLTEFHILHLIYEFIIIIIVLQVKLHFRVFKVILHLLCEKLHFVRRISYDTNCFSFHFALLIINFFIICYLYQHIKKSTLGRWLSLIKDWDYWIQIEPI